VISSIGRLTLVFGQPRMFTDVSAAPTLYLAPDGLSLNLAALLANTAYDIFYDQAANALCAALMPPWSSGGFSLIPNVTAIFDGTGAVAWNNLAAAFDGVISKPFANSAYIGATLAANSGLANCLGQDYGTSPQAVAQFTLTAPSDDTFTAGSPIELLWSDDRSHWTVGWTGSLPMQTVGQTVTFATGNNGTHRAWMVNLSGDGVHRIKVSQLQPYSVAGPPVRGIVWNSGNQVNANAMAAVYNSGPGSLAQFGGQWLGSIKTDATTPTVTAHFSAGQSRVFNLYNSRNQVGLALIVCDPAAVRPASYSPAQESFYVIGPANGKTSNSASLVIGEFGARVKFDYAQDYYINASAQNGQYWSGIVLSTQPALNMYGNLLAGKQEDGTIDTTTQDIGFNGRSFCIADPFFGPITASMMEGCHDNVSAFSGPPNQYMTVEWMG